jgi:hypothetical protein
MSDIINLSFSVRCGSPSTITTVTVPNEECKENASLSWPWGKQAMVGMLQEVQASVGYEENGRI